MKIISYTKMRDDLANVLELLRKGEPITITQRGKPDLMLNAKPGDETGAVGLSTLREEGAEYGIMQHHKPESEESGKTGLGSGGVSGSVGPGRMIQSGLNSGSAISGKGPGLSFEEAKRKTKKKHASIIKALEDK